MRAGESRSGTGKLLPRLSWGTCQAINSHARVGWHAGFDETLASRIERRATKMLRNVQEMTRGLEIRIGWATIAIFNANAIRRVYLKSLSIDSQATLWPFAHALLNNEAATNLSWATPRPT